MVVREDWAKKDKEAANWFGKIIGEIADYIKG